MDGSAPASELDDRLEAGDAIDDRFVIVSHRGAGAMGVVYEAMDNTLERRVAIKLCRAGRTAKQDARMWREARAMARLSHPNVITVHEVGHYSGRVYIAMELVDGGTVRDWLGTPRKWRDVLRVFIQAARGLAAAHDVGLIHGDVKPANMLHGSDGRVRIADFGLARGTQDDESGVETLSGVSGRSGERLPLDEPATKSQVGTPGYIAPEQFGDEIVDERVDQFSFCVSLFEGLWGKRPFQGLSMAELYLATSRGEIEYPEPRVEVPRWVRELVERGLRPDPTERFTSMNDLVAALEADPAKARRRGLAVGGVIVALGATAWISSSLSDGPSPCADVEAAIEAHWNADRKTQLDAKFREVGPTIAEPTSSRVADTLDAYAGSWAEQRTEACRATRVRGEQSESLLDLRIACLDRRATELASVMQQLETADVEVMVRVDELLASLGPLGSCADTTLLQAQVPLPEDPADREAAESMQAEAMRISAASAAARGRGEESHARALLQRAEALGHAPTLADARIALASVEHAIERPSEARASLVAAHRNAAASGYAYAGFDSALRLATTIARTKKNATAGLEWLEVARGWAERLDLGPEQRSRLVYAHGHVLRAGERWDEALAVLAEDPQRDAELPAIARSRLAAARGSTHAIVGRFDEARREYERAAELIRPEYGDNHPRLAGLYADIANLDARESRFEEALAGHRKTLKIESATYGPQSAKVAEIHGSIANALWDLGQHEQALEAFDQAIAAAAGDTTPLLRTQMVLNANYSNSLAQAGYFERAVSTSERALELGLQLYGADSSKVAQIRINLGNAYGANGQDPKAIEQYELALPVIETELGPTHPSLPSLYLNQALAYMKTEQWDACETSIARGLEIDATRNDPGSLWPSSAWTVRARLAAARGDLPGAAEARARSVQALETIDERHPKLREALYRWGLALETLGDMARAQSALLRARDLATPKAAIPEQRADIFFALARVHWARSKTRADAHVFAHQALELYPEDNEGHADVEQWLAAHGE
ncbi:MAG: serine/threonine-protein kinase [Myxococcota bacterium]